jgi:hypothetical protein
VSGEWGMEGVHKPPLRVALYSGFSPSIIMIHRLIKCPKFISLIRAPFLPPLTNES